MAKLSALIITLNEQDNIEECIKSIRWADEIIVVDSGSKDSTVAIARKFTSKVYINEFKDFSSQKNFCLSKAACEWVLFLDADERITEDLRLKIQGVIKYDEGPDSYYIKRSTYIFGRLFKHGGHDKDYQLRLFKKRKGHFYQPVHEKVELSGGRAGYIDEPMLHYSSSNISQYVGKLNLYTDLESAYMAGRQKRISAVGIFTKPMLRFIQKYIVQLGFMDGPEGFIFYTFSSYYDFVRCAKLWEINNAGSSIRSKG